MVVVMDMANLTLEPIGFLQAGGGPSGQVSIQNRSCRLTRPPPATFRRDSGES
jgi:hypothetical protein